eukprot:scaffold2151_cov99-Isochrysis_galbana.AAC.10
MAASRLGGTQVAHSCGSVGTVYAAPSPPASASSAGGKPAGRLPAASSAAAVAADCAQMRWR